MARERGRRRTDRRPLAVRLQALAEVVGLVDGRIDPEVVDSARAVADRATGRLAITGDATVVAVAGATGSGKSSTVNAVSGAEVTQPGVRRPTTSRPLAVVFGEDDQHELLDWLDIAARQRLPGIVEGAGTDLDGLVLVDLPDHDSTEAAHRAEVDRLVELVDMVVWVVDPQKYADAALHERYLVPMARHAPSTTVLLNQVDLLPEADRARVEADLTDLLAAEGLDRATVTATSTVTGQGIDRVRESLASAVAAKIAATERLSADVDAALTAIGEQIGEVGSAEVSRDERRRLVDALAVAAGVPTVVDAVRQAWRRRGGRATGWPVLAWLGSLRPDPLRRLHLDLAPTRRALSASAGGSSDTLEPGRTSLPAAIGVERARVDAALRHLVDRTSTGLPDSWIDLVADAARADADRLPDALDRAVAGTDLDLSRHRGWWRGVTTLQWLLTAVWVAGLGWHLVEFLVSWLGFPELPPVLWQGVPVASWMVVGGVAAGLVTAAASRIGVEVGARRRARQARTRLFRSVTTVAVEHVLQPVEAELSRHGRVRELLSGRTEN